MQTIGERLEEARKRKGISVREAAETTKIRGDYLQKFEANSFDLDLPPLYIRGFLRAYARYLDLDPERIVSDFNTVLASEGKPSRRENREVYGRVDFAEARAAPNVEPAKRRPPVAPQDQALMLKFGLLGGGAIVVVVIIILLFKVIFSGSPAKPSKQPRRPPPRHTSRPMPRRPSRLPRRRGDPRQGRAGFSTAWCSSTARLVAANPSRSRNRQAWGHHGRGSGQESPHGGQRQARGLTVPIDGYGPLRPRLLESCMAKKWAGIPPAF